MSYVKNFLLFLPLYMYVSVVCSGLGVVTYETTYTYQYFDFILQCDVTEM